MNKWTYKKAIKPMLDAMYLGKNKRNTNMTTLQNDQEMDLTIELLDSKGLITKFPPTFRPIRWTASNAEIVTIIPEEEVPHRKAVLKALGPTGSVQIGAWAMMSPDRPSQQAEFATLDVEIVAGDFKTARIVAGEPRPITV